MNRLTTEYTGLHRKTPVGFGDRSVRSVAFTAPPFEFLKGTATAGSLACVFRVFRLLRGCFEKSNP